MNNKNEAKEKFIKLNFKPNNLSFLDIQEPTGHCKNNNKINWIEIIRLIISLLNGLRYTPPLTRSRGKVTCIKAKEVVINKIDKIIIIELEKIN